MGMNGWRAHLIFDSYLEYDEYTMPLNFCRSLRLIACTAMVTAATSIGDAATQDSIQTGDGLLMVKAAMPETARVGEEFSYDVEVVNTSDNTVLHNVKLKQRKAKGFTIESVSMHGQNDQSEHNATASGQQGKSEKNASDKSRANQGDEKDRSESSKRMMVIEKLEPGESRTFTVKASGDEDGQFRSCLEISSYTPALCLASEIVKPELELTKMTPKRANRCNVIELNYKVKNGGSGDVGKFTITDSLGEGLMTIDGESELSFPVDELATGETREFVARVYAKKPGTFSSRAIASADDSELKSRSKKTTTEVVAADLTAQVDGPSRIYADDLATFTATITNTGNVAAESVNVTVDWPSEANLADLSDYKIRKSKASTQSRNGEPAPAEENAKSDDAKSKNGPSGDAKMQSESFVIDRLDPGHTAEFTYAIRTGNLDKIRTKVRARHVCTVDAAEDRAESTAKTTVTSMATAEVVRLAALQLAVFDAEDPVRKDSKVEYTIEVWNEGDAPDQNVRLVAMLPKNLKFDSADGPTEMKNDGSKITFDPIKTMRPGERVEYTITAKPTGTGNARFEAALTSKMLQQEVVGEEPTRLFGSETN